MLLDSSSHPTCDGRWTLDRPGMTHDQVAADLAASGYAGGLAIGLPGVGGYEHRRFWELTRRHARLLPVAALTRCDSPSAVQQDLDEIERVGYRLVKIHPRLLGYEQALEALPMLMASCVARGLGVLLCTYPEYRSDIDPATARRIMADSISADAACLVLHSGVLDPEPFADVADANPRVLLDFSLSLLKYPDEVRPQVVRLGQRLPRSVCLGSDGPEWSYAQVAAALAALSDAHLASGLGGTNLWRWMEALDPQLLPPALSEPLA